MALREFVELSPSWGNNCARECSLSRTLVERESRYKTIFVRGIIRSSRAHHRSFNQFSNVDDELEGYFYSSNDDMRKKKIWAVKGYLIFHLVLVRKKRDRNNILYNIF